MKPIAFQIDSKPVTSERITAGIVKAIAFLDTLPLGSLVTARQMAIQSGATHNTLKNSAATADWGGRRVKHGSRMLYGNSKTIAAYKEHFGI